MLFILLFYYHSFQKKVNREIWTDELSLKAAFIIRRTETDPSLMQDPSIGDSSLTEECWKTSTDIDDSTIVTITNG